MPRKENVLKHFEEQKSQTDTRVNADIEKYRKGTLSLTVSDQYGNAIKNAKVIARQKNHEYKYGANLFMLDEFETEDKNRIYREKFAEAFNIATLPFYWNALEPQKGKTRYTKDSERLYRRPPADLCIEYCKEKGIEPKVHCLNYESATPKWLKNESADTVKFYLEKRMKQLSQRYADIIPSWEVTNECFNNYEIMKKDFASVFYTDNDFAEWSFETADKYFPNNRLIINDNAVFDNDYNFFWGNRSPYYMQIERMLLKGVKHLDSIGMKFHSFLPKEKEYIITESRYNPQRLYEVLDKYAELGKKMQITEMTIPAYSAKDEDEYIQAELIKNLYRIFFSHKAMEAIIYWNLPDGYAAFAPIGDMSKGENIYYGGLLRHDLSEKPAYKVIKNLFKKEWCTNAETITNEQGIAEFRGFYGDYDVTVIYDGKEVPVKIKLSEFDDNKKKIICSI